LECVVVQWFIICIFIVLYFGHSRGDTTFLETNRNEKGFQNRLFVLLCWLRSSYEARPQNIFDEGKWNYGA
jgi:hypothetical protein